MLNQILSLFEEPHYLEIGVNSGDTFFALRAHYKVAVDPAFMFAVDEAKRRDPNSNFYRVESDVYFGNCIASHERFDVIYLDGLHTVEQTLRDFCNAITFLKSGGIIVIDDVVPNSYHASLPDLKTAIIARNHARSQDASWMGDVYRLVFFIQSFFQQYRYATVAENHGQLVVWQSQRSAKEVVQKRLEDIGRAPFENVIVEATAFNRLSFPEIMALLRDRK